MNRKWSIKKDERSFKEYGLWGVLVEFVIFIIIKFHVCLCVCVGKCKCPWKTEGSDFLALVVEVAVGCLM